MASHKLLIAARAKIADIGCWTQHKWARDKNAREVNLLASSATCWCAEGAIRAVADCPEAVSAARKVLREAAGTEETIVEWNDAGERTHAEVLAAFDKAIAATARKRRPAKKVAPESNP